MRDAGADKNGAADGTGHVKCGAIVNAGPNTGTVGGMAGGNDLTGKPAETARQYERIPLEFSEARQIPPKPANWACMTSGQRRNWYKREY